MDTSDEGLRDSRIRAAVLPVSSACGGTPEDEAVANVPGRRERSCPLMVGVMAGVMCCFRVASKSSNVGKWDVF